MPRPLPSARHLAFTGGILALLCLPPAPAPAGSRGPRAEPRAGLTAPQLARFEEGQDTFLRFFDGADGIGPRYNEAGCVGCHQSPVVGGIGPTYKASLHYGVDLRWFVDVSLATLAELVARADGRPFVGLAPGGGSLLRRRQNDPAVLPEVVPDYATAMSSRRVADLRGVGAIASLPDGAIEANARRQGRRHPEVAGRVVRDERGRVARFGSQLQFPAILKEAVEHAFERELGVEPHELAALRTPSGASVRSAVADFLRFVEPPPSRPTDWAATGVAAPDHPDVVRGEVVFEEVGCAVCHVPRYDLSSGSVVEPYSDFLLHDLGPHLDDGVALGPEARASEYRTSPLWGYFDRARLMHDERGGNLELAIHWHGGQAAGARAAWSLLPASDQRALKLFLQSLRTP